MPLNLRAFPPRFDGFLSTNLLSNALCVLFPFGLEAIFIAEHIQSGHSQRTMMCNTDMDPLKYFLHHSFPDHICDAATNATGNVSQILKASAGVDGDDLVNFEPFVVGSTLSAILSQQIYATLLLQV